MNVPQLNDEKVKVLIKRIKSPYVPVFVPVVLEEYSVVNECFPNVEKKVINDGGELIYGWQLWKGKLITEAEFHAVWKSPEGKLIDITPKQPPAEDILFIQDDNVKYSGVQIENIRIRNTNNEVINDYIVVHKALFRISNKGERAHSHNISFNEKEAALYSELKSMAKCLEVYVQRGGNRYTSCYCDSGLIYESCHRDLLEKLIYESKL